MAHDGDDGGPECMHLDNVADVVGSGNVVTCMILMSCRCMMAVTNLLCSAGRCLP